MTGDTYIRRGTAAVVAAVAVFAAVVSYSHLYDLARAHGETGAAARLLPLSVDGLILAVSFVLLHEARAGRGAPGLARVCMVAGVAATLGGNIDYGIRFGPVGAVISAWPVLAFIGSAELLMVMISRARVVTVPQPEVPAASNGHDPMVTRFARTWNEGSPRRPGDQAGAVLRSAPGAGGMRPPQGGTSQVDRYRER